MEYWFEVKAVKVKRKLADVQKRYNEANKKKLSKEELLKKMKMELEYFEVQTLKANANLAQCQRELEAKALKTETGAAAVAYIEELIEEKK